MARKLLFDASDGDAFRRQQQRFDWQLLQSSFVHRVGGSGALGRVVDVLHAEYGYQVFRLDAQRWRTEGVLHGDIAATLGFWPSNGYDLDAVDDALGDLALYRLEGSDPEATGTVLAIDNYDTFAAADPPLAYDVLDIIARQARRAALVGHPVLGIGASTVDLGAVGATPVMLTVGPA